MLSYNGLQLKTLKKNTKNIRWRKNPRRAFVRVKSFKSFCFLFLVISAWPLAPARTPMYGERNRYTDDGARRIRLKSKYSRRSPPKTLRAQKRTVKRIKTYEMNDEMRP